MQQYAAGQQQTAGQQQAVGQPDAIGQYVSNVAQRLGAEGFTCGMNVQHEGNTLNLVAKKSGFELSKFGNAETFFVISYFPTLTVEVLRGYSAWSYKYALSMKQFPLPCGFFEAVTCYPVALVNDLSEPVAAAIRSETATKHFGSFEFPVIKHMPSGYLYYYDKTPAWGAAYFKGFRTTTHRILG